ncbi:hypothetical protein HMPREF1870_02665 [Bacteroidales bacterium KA00344]|nr:hypothetical protein HMPREF1870_02665 [Bacteroidales bacterium KA00344]
MNTIKKHIDFNKQNSKNCATLTFIFYVSITHQGESPQYFPLDISRFVFATFSIPQAM